MIVSKCGLDHVANSSGVKNVAPVVATSCGTRLAEYAMFYLMLDLLHLHYLVALTAALMISNLLKFFLYRSFVFRRHLPTD